MTREGDGARERAFERVRAVLGIAVRASDPGDPLHREALAAIGSRSTLSAEGVALALRHHVETSATDRELDSLVRSVRPAEATWVVPSTNVCTASVRALALAVASAPRVFVRRSRREVALAELLVRELGWSETFARAEGRIELVDALAPSSGHAVHAYGSDATLATLAAALHEDVRLWGHGTGFGIAWVGGGCDLDAAACALASDVVPFDQAGCLSPRIAYVEGDAARSERFARALATALDEAGSRVPRGRIDEGELARFESTLEALGPVHRSVHATVGVDLDPAGLLLPPPARCVLVVPVPSSEAMPKLLGASARFVTSVGLAGGLDGDVPLGALFPRARLAALGSMQRPPLDGPVDRR
jgi:hypothetical protein